MSGGVCSASSRRDVGDHSEFLDDIRKKRRKITHEEIAEYMAKRTEKKLSIIAEKLKPNGCDKDSNPEVRFVWRKKIERDIARGIHIEKNFSLKSEKKRNRETILLIEQMKRTRNQRATEKARLKEETELLGREKKESAFQFGDNKIRSEILVSDGKTKPIDEQGGINSTTIVTEIDDHLEDDFMKKSLKSSIGETEETDSVLLGTKDEVNLDSSSTEVLPPAGWWQDNKHCSPKKPKYFNRVRTGYNWSTYNRTHYDHQNLPPKSVQAYKFNIFYPDMIDKSRVPSFTIEKDGDSTDTCIIRFHGGPPYVDIGFRIFNKEWEYSRKQGYKCNFENGILKLYFNFKQYPYRR